MSRKDGVKDEAEKIKSLEEAKAAGKKLTDDEVGKATGGVRGRLVQCPHCHVYMDANEYRAHVIACKAREKNKQEENNESPDLAIPGTIDLF